MIITLKNLSHSIYFTLQFIFRFDSLARDNSQDFSNWHRLGTSLQQVIPQWQHTLGGLQSQDPLWGSNPSLCGSVEFLSMADVIITPIPYRWTVTVSITLPPQIMLCCRHFHVDLHIHALKALSHFNLGESYFLLPYVFPAASFGVQILDFV